MKIQYLINVLRLVVLTYGCLVVSSIEAQDLSVTADPVTITRGDTAALSGSASGGCAPYTYKWTNWTVGRINATKTGQAITAKVLYTSDVTVTATDAAGNTASATVTVTVNKRGWNIRHSTSVDALSDWGSFPLWMPNLVGLNVNANNNSGRPVIGNTYNDWSDCVTITKLEDENGPFDGFYYNATHNLRVERETWINQYLKGQVSGAGFNLVTLQNNHYNSQVDPPCISAANVLSAIKGHENAGVSGNSPDFSASPKKGGHSGLFKAKQDSDPDQFNAAQVIEAEWFAESEEDRKSSNNAIIAGVDDALADASADPLTGNGNGSVVQDYDTRTQQIIYSQQDN